MKKISLVFALPFLFIHVHAQNTLYGGQVFHQVTPKVPYFGFDLIRLANPQVIIESHPEGSSEWVKDSKLVTQRYSQDPDIFTELGSYYFDTVTGTWRTDAVNRYTFNYDQAEKRVLSGTDAKFYDNPDYNMMYGFRISFNADNRVDSEYYESVNGGITSPYRTTSYTYQDGRAVSGLVKYGFAYWFRSDYEYDSAGKMSLVISLYSTDGQNYDSSSKVFYSYDEEGRLTETDYQTYKMQDSPGDWTTTRRVKLMYNSSGSLSGTEVNVSNAKDNYNEVPYDHFKYFYDSKGNMTEMQEIRYTDGIPVSGEKTVIIYDASNHAQNGFGYLWSNGGFGTVSSYKYTFSQMVTGLQEAAMPAGNIYPNPASSLLFLPAGAASIKIFDPNGKLVLEERNFPAGRYIDVSGLHQGIYFVSVDHNRPVKLLKQ